MMEGEKSFFSFTKNKNKGKRTKLKEKYNKNHYIFYLKLNKYIFEEDVKKSGSKNAYNRHTLH